MDRNLVGEIYVRPDLRAVYYLSLGGVGRFL